MKNRNDAVRFLEDCYQLYEQKMYHIGLKDDFISFFFAGVVSGKKVRYNARSVYQDIDVCSIIEL